MKQEHYEIQNLGHKTNRWSHYGHLGIFFTAEEAQRVLEAHRFDNYKPNKMVKEGFFDLDSMEFRIVKIVIETTVIEEAVE